ncbi:hypothetical protein V8G54_034754 [Vigna mungo]|uniref:Uncharacterized protein n=1 Tax=Vigna mungo TaxID=3915 RepID=A0AAQ3MDY4_VIGMU
MQVLWHCIMHLPPSCMSHITCKLLQNVHIPVAVVVSKAKPWFITQIMDDIKDWWIGSEETGFHHFFLFFITFPEVLQEVHMFWNPVPPCEDFIKIPLVPSIVGDNFIDVIHKQLECTI